MSITVRDRRVVVRGPVNETHEVVLEPSGGKADTDALRAALAVVQAYRDAALKALRTKEKDADWTTVDYAVKTDCVVVTVSQGACG